MKQQKRNITIAAILAIAASLSLSSFAADTANLQVEAQNAINRFERTDPSISQYFNTAYGYAVFPDVGKGGLVIGGAHGKGVVFQQGKVIGTATMSQASIGAQIGGQTFAEVIFFETPTALENFKSGNFEMGADVGAVVAAAGAAKTARYSHGVAVFTMPNKGLMAQASVGGQKFTFEPLQQ
jgi:lipid-binding SYLF domain-containing protein